jgi:hypothetical protein
MPKKIKAIYCCCCNKDIKPRLTSGEEVYPHREDLHSLPFWRCDTCGNFVGCHHKDKNNPTLPLGIIATPEIKNARRHIHALIDPLWKSGKIPRGTLYKKISDAIGKKYHAANISSIFEARKIYRAALEIKKGLS